MAALKEAAVALKQANAFCQPSVLSMRLKADWEEATPLFERAGQLFKQAGSPTEAVVAYEKAAQGQERCGSQWHAAKNLEKAADAARDLKRWEQFEDLYRRAAEHYKQAQRATAAAEALARGAKGLEDVNAKVARDLYLEAVEIIEDEGKQSLQADLYRQALGCFVKNQQYDDATALLLRFAAAISEDGPVTAQNKAYLSAVSLCLYREDSSQAWAVYQDALGVESFALSEHAMAAEELLDSYRTGDAAAVQQCIARRNSLLSDLDVHFARLVRKLPVGDVAALGQLLPTEGGVLDEEPDEMDLR